MGIQNFSMFPLERIARNGQGMFDGNFDDSLLPFELCENVFIEDVSSRISADEFEYCKQELGTETTRTHLALLTCSSSIGYFQGL